MEEFIAAVVVTSQKEKQEERRASVARLKAPRYISSADEKHAAACPPRRYA
jgi:hypothetical protein